MEVQNYALRKDEAAIDIEDIDRFNSLNDGEIKK
jgi:hypothetical protein